MSILERIGHDGMPPGKFFVPLPGSGQCGLSEVHDAAREIRKTVEIYSFLCPPGVKSVLYFSLTKFKSPIFLISNDSKGQMCAADHQMILSAKLKHPPVLVTEELKKSNKSVKRACSICSILVKIFTDIMKKQNKINERCFVLHLPLCFVRWPHISRSGLFLSCRLSLPS